jgi:hypothetical protein
MGRGVSINRNFGDLIPILTMNLSIIIDSAVAAVLIDYRWRISSDLGFQSLV